MKYNPDDHKLNQRIKESYALGEQERIIDVIYKHPMYLIMTFAITIVGYAIVLIATALLAPTFFGEGNGASYRIVAFVAVFMAVIIGLVFIIATFLYRQTKIIISNENLIQVMQKDLLHNKTSRLALTDIEDVTAEQHGFFATLLGYGNLVIETAGEQANFIFTFCPNPNLIAKELIDAKQAMIDGIDTP